MGAGRETDNSNLISVSSDGLMQQLVAISKYRVNFSLTCFHFCYNIRAMASKHLYPNEIDVSKQYDIDFKKIQLIHLVKKKGHRYIKLN